MSREISRAESWEKTYEAFQEINFAAFDFNSVKQSLLDYIKEYFPEQFNDFIESSEFIAIIESFAYISELLAYRIDMNSHENFITVAQRKQSILRLAKLVSYDASRNMPARGLVKITSVTTTETTFDSRSINLANQKINWNDSNNADWKEQFILIMNQVLDQDFGSVSPSDRVQVDDVLFELYEMKNNPLVKGVQEYSASVSGKSLPMELVPSALNEFGPYERRPSSNTTFSITYGSDGIGDSSDTTGFFCFSKQGTLQSETHSYDGITPNQTTLVDVENINDIDVWVNNVNPDTGETIVTEIVDEQGRNLGSSGEWVDVEASGASNVLFNANPKRNKYEVETLEDDKIRVIYGDGEFADIPSGTFNIWYRTSVNDDVVIPRSAVVNRTATFTYKDSSNTRQTFTITFSMIGTLTNSAASEDIESIRRSAPSVYYTQDRMVNGQDYNTYMLQDASILKTRAFNRTFAGDSKYLAWNDPSNYYQDVKMFGDDLTITYDESEQEIKVNPTATIQQLIINYIQPYLSNIGVIIFHESVGIPIPNRMFTAAEVLEIDEAIEAADLTNSGYPIQLAYIPPFLHGMQSVDFGGSILTGTQSLIHRPFTSFEATVTMASMAPVSFQYIPADTTSIGLRRVINNISGPVLATYSDLIQDMNVTLGTTGNVTLVDGNLHFTYKDATTTSEISRVRVFDVSLFKHLESPFGNPVVRSPVDGSLAATWHPYEGETLFPEHEVQPTFFITRTSFGWSVQYNSIELLGQSTSTKFWFSNNDNQIISGDTLNPNKDELILLSANLDRETTGVLGVNTHLDVVGGTADTDPTNAGLLNLTTLSLQVQDAESTSQSEDSLLADLLDRQYVTESAVGAGGNIILPSYMTYELGFEEIGVQLQGGGKLTMGVDFSEVSPNVISVTSAHAAGDLIIFKYDFLYYTRNTSADPWVLATPTTAVKTRYKAGQANVKRSRGRAGYNFLWKHISPRFNLIDPSTTNIIDIYMITRGYYTQLKTYLANVGPKPELPSSFSLKNDYGYLLNSKMMSDTVVLHPGSVKLIFGSKSIPQLRSKIKVVRDENSGLTDNEIKVRIVEATRNFFDINAWEFGEKFSFSELSAVIHSRLTGNVSSVLLVPEYTDHYFGDLYEVLAMEDEIIQPDISVFDVEIISSVNATTIKQRVY